MTLGRRKPKRPGDVFKAVQAPFDANRLPLRPRQGHFFPLDAGPPPSLKIILLPGIFEKIIMRIWRLILGQAVPEKKESIKPSIFVKIIDSEKKSYYDISE